MLVRAKRYGMKNFEEWLKDNAFKDDVPMVEEGLNDALWTNNVIKYQRMYEEYTNGFGVGLVDKIKAHCKEVQDQEVNVNNNDYSSGKFCVASVVLKIIKKHEPEPPTVRPMSELRQEGTFTFIALIERKDNSFKFHECMERNENLVQGSHQDFAFFKSNDYENEEFKMLGWLYELPNPNEKL